MGISTFPEGSISFPTTTLTASAIAAPANVTLSATGHKVEVPIVYNRSFSGAMVSLSGTYAGMNVAFEALTVDSPTAWRAWPTWHMLQGLWMTSDILPTNASHAYWMPSNGATSVRMRVTAIGSGSASGGGIAMHAPASVGQGAVAKQDWVSTVIEQNPGNNVQVMVPMFTQFSTFLGTRSAPTVATSWTVPAGKRLRIHSYSATYLANAGVGKCVVSLRSNMAGATTIGSDLLGSWAFAPTAGGTNPNGQWSGLASGLTEPIDIYSPTGAASVGIGAAGSSGTTGSLTFNLFGYLVG